MRFFNIIIILILGHLIAAPVLAENAYELKIEKYQIIGEVPIDQAIVDTTLKPFLGPLKGLQQLQQAAAALQSALQDEGYGFYSVTLAPQTLDSGVVKLNLTPIVIDNIWVRQGFVPDIYFSDENIKAGIPALQTGQSPNIYRAAREVELANKNPSKQVNVQFSRSQQADKIDANILVSAKKTDNFYTWLNNTGTKYTGDYRLGVGYRHNNFFDKDHEIALSFTTSPDYPKDVQQYGFSYRIPLYQQLAVWQLYAYYSDIDSGVVAGGFDVSGSGTFLGTKYEWHLPKMAAAKQYSHELIVGLDDKLFDNEVFFTGSSLGNDVRSTPLSIVYQGMWKEVKRTFKFNLELDKNMRLGSLNDNRTYALNRYQAEADWELARYAVDFEWLLNRWMLRGRLNGQYTDQALISGEQFGIGGITGGVRGFIERELSGDTGVRGHLELYFPSFWNQQMRALGYIDGGYVRRKDALPGEIDSEGIASVGLGLIWTLKDRANLRIYLSRAINGNRSDSVEDPTEKGDHKIQFNVFINF